MYLFEWDWILVLANNKRRTINGMHRLQELRRKTVMSSNPVEPQLFFPRSIIILCCVENNKFVLRLLTMENIFHRANKTAKRWSKLLQSVVDIVFYSNAHSITSILFLIYVLKLTSSNDKVMMILKAHQTFTTMKYRTTPLKMWTAYNIYTKSAEFLF